MMAIGTSWRRFLLRCAGGLAGLLLLIGCSVPVDGQDAGNKLQIKSEKTKTNAYTRRNSVVINSARVPTETGRPFIIGLSAEGRPLTTYRFGTGPVSVALIGAIHGSYEANTAALISRFVQTLTDKPGLVPEQVSVFVIPAMNPDGLAKIGAAGRVNANRVDLNRNWDCRWRENANVYQGVAFTTGPSAFSEPETRAMRDFLLQNDFRVAVFYHSRGAVIFYGECGGAGQSVELAERVSQATGYSIEDSAEYPTTRSLPGSITGEGADYWDSQGLAAIDIELSTRDADNIDWAENYEGLLAIMDYAARTYGNTQIVESAGTPMPTPTPTPTPRTGGAS